MAAYEEQEYNKPFSFRIWAKMIPFFKPYRRYFIITLGLNIFLAGVDVLTPLFQSYAIDHFITLDTLDGLQPFAITYILMIVAQTVSVYFSVHAATTIEMNVGRDLKWAQFQHLHTLSFSYYNTTPVGYIHARVMSDTLRIATMIAWGLVDMFWALIYVASVFVIMFLLDGRLAFIILLIVPCIALLTVYFQNQILHWNRKVRKINSQITSAYNEGITGVKTSKSMGIESDNDQEFFLQTTEMYCLASRSARLNAVYIPMILLFGSVASAIVLIRGGGMVREQVMELGTLSVFISYAVIIFEPIQQLARLLSELISCQANIERVMDLLEQKPNVVDQEAVIAKYGDAFTAKKENWERIQGDIVFEDVSFQYPDGKEYVLEHFNLHVKAGMSVAIVGETGAGKSTLVNLLGRFFEPTKGRILIDGVDYRERSQLWLHSQIGYVLQSPHLFSGTVRENIRYGRLDATDKEVEEAARQVSADMVAFKLPQGYESNVGESGGRLSVGEKQLISFARAILANPAIFVLDEATSSIDTQTEQLIQKAIRHLLKGHTSFVIAHRLSTIRQSDLILVVKDGKIIEKGSHKDLLMMGGYYFDLYSRQFEEEAAMEVFGSH
ncbi:MAG: ABC transporter ATP-binding protein [Lachnospiraceae bacterium]|nr:ABC transporter ATP-binding protein [Lachnospiraceae bacterium]